MENIVKLNQVEEKILTLRGQNILLDSDVASLYEVETKRINEAVSNNPDKFPEGYILEIDKEEFDSLRSKISTLKNLGRGQHTKYLPKAFTEKGLYMLATILKSPRATETTIEIVETFTKIRELSRTFAELKTIPDEPRQKKLMQRGGEIMADLIGNELNVTDTETSLEINMALVKFKHTIKRRKDKS